MMKADLTKRDPVEHHAGAGDVGGGGVPVDGLDGACHGVLVDRETVHLHPARVGHRGEQADVELLHPMATDRQVVRLLSAQSRGREAGGGKRKKKKKKKKEEEKEHANE